MLLFCSVFSDTAQARVFKPIQIFMPGNFAGKAFALNEQKKPIAAGCWKAPSLLRSFLQDKTKEQIVLGCGNDSSIYSLTSFITEGSCDRQLVELCEPIAAAVGPADLMIFRKNHLNDEIRRRVLTNLEYPNDHQIFLPYRQFSADSTRIWFFNFIGAEGFSMLPLDNWGQMGFESPARTLRRKNLGISENDFTLSMAHMNKTECQNLARELNLIPGHHIIVQVPYPGEEAAFSRTDILRENKVFFISLSDGAGRLPLLSIFRRNQGYPRISLRMLPYAKSDGKIASTVPANTQIDLQNRLFETLNMIPTTIRPSTAPFCFKPELHARLINEQMRTDVSMIFAPEEKFKTDNVISLADCLSAFSNEKLFQFRISGEKLQQAIEEIMAWRGSRNPVFAGLNFSMFANRPQNIKVGRFALMPRKLYNISINREMLDFIKKRNILPPDSVEAYKGDTLWDVWKIQLKSLKILETHFFEP
jgi:hypothetical protein